MKTMSIQEQQTVREKYYNEAMRYMSNAKENLQKAGKEDNFYLDDKYVKTACGVAYNGVLKALDGYFELKEVKKPRGRRSIEFYENALAKLDKKLLAYLNNVYQVLHLLGYYDGNRSVKIIQAGIEDAHVIINYIKPKR
ncbi:MAG: DUF5618 family protein [Bacteroidales bacterium]|jgi:hypothetical protein|nr:DUF5618 family protein [Bacteroidales bacterium]